MVRLITVVLALYAGCSPQLLAYDAKFEHMRSWQFLHARGGLKIAQPIQKSGQWWLPITCNVSGIETISAKPKIRHSQLAWSKSQVRTDGTSLFLTIYTALQSPRKPSAKCGAAKIKALEPGVYEVFYLNPSGTTKKLTEITIPEC